MLPLNNNENIAQMDAQSLNRIDLQNRIICNILNAFTVPFDQFNASPINTSIITLKINLTNIKLNGSIYIQLLI